jgi:hypothetical protein
VKLAGEGEAKRVVAACAGVPTVGVLQAPEAVLVVGRERREDAADVARIGAREDIAVLQADPVAQAARRPVVRADGVGRAVVRVTPGVGPRAAATDVRSGVATLRTMRTARGRDLAGFASGRNHSDARADADVMLPPTPIQRYPTRLSQMREALRLEPVGALALGRGNPHAAASKRATDDAERHPEGAQA